MIELRKAITTLLESVCVNVYHQDIPETVSYPYLIYDLPTTNSDGENSEMFYLDIDIWDEDYDSSRVEALMTLVSKTIDKQIINTDDFSVVLFLENKLSLSDPDPKVRRRRCTFIGNIYGKGS